MLENFLNQQEKLPVRVDPCRSPRPLFSCISLTILVIDVGWMCEDSVVEVDTDLQLSLESVFNIEGSLSLRR